MNWIDINELERPYNGQQVLVKLHGSDWSVATYYKDSDTFIQLDFGQQFCCAFEDVKAWATVTVN